MRDLLTRCVECRRFTGPCLRQPTAPLPADRCSSARPFEITGVDFAGPLFIKDNAGVTSKVYICLLTCAAIRGIHLELVSSLSTADFILAFKRFVATRGLCRVVYSDNAKTFKRASELLAQLFENLRTKEVRDYFASSGIEWRFICERSPWWGGFYERLVRSVKTPLKKILGNALLSYDELNTTLKEIEATINSRPLTYVYNNPNDAQPLSPSHFILGDRLTLVPPITTSTTILAEPTKNDLVARIRYRERLLNAYWDAWRGEYLQQLSHQAAKGPTTDVPILPHQIVIVKEDNVPRHKWHLGRIVKVYIGKDKISRSAKIRTAKGLINRSVDLLFPLEIYEDPSDPVPAADADPVEEQEALMLLQLLRL